MQTKLSQINAAYIAGDYRKALCIAAKFPNLGIQRNAILDAHLAITNPRWMLGLGHNIDQTILLGIKALIVRYKL